MTLLADGTDEDLRDSALEAVRTFHCPVCGYPQVVWWMAKWVRHQCPTGCGYFRMGQRGRKGGMVKFYRVHEAWYLPITGI